ncbi:HNH endonuclease (plasmid) [Vibrio coralliilyticus OCN008]|uniref:HNH endonuclease n=1 Tax=Vibrio coralliilyticus TaxID=190893 RepID=UPI0003912DFE|nr:HNH endonuclease signature motif containing protein [Vibrio coralliilyticus]ERB64216.1 hypothetical protein N779_16860 [Vibrio coralliilyticus OCN008]QIJ87633.1 HNH endonuclease [Vibrio coralliilyticus OCN008]
MLSEVIYSREHKEFLDKKIDSEDFGSSSWSDEDLKDIKHLIKSHYIKAQKHTCPYCQQKTNTNNGRVWDIEHILPRSASPRFMFEPTNLCVACVDCNSAKSDKKVTSSQAQKNYPKDSSMFDIIHPHFDTYDKHILVIKAGMYYIAKGKKGEKTIEICRLNRFYEFADYGEYIQVDNRIFMLSNALNESKDDEEKKSIRREIAALTINSLMDE